MYTIYKHTNLINGKSYIGQTHFSNLNLRWYNGKGYNKQTQPCFRDAINKYGWENFKHEVLETNIETKKEANEREKYWIAYYHTWVKDPLCNGYNLTAGGDDHTYTAKKVLQLTENKTILAEYNSLSDAEDKTGILAKNIYKACVHKINSAGSYYWCYKENYTSYIIKKSKNLYATKSVCQIDFNGNLINTYKTLSAAANSVNGSSSKISSCCYNKRKSAYGYIWCFLNNFNTFKLPTFDHHYKIRAVVQLTHNNNYIRTFTSLSEAAAAISNKASAGKISMVCTHKRNQAYGYKWMYLEEWERLQNEERKS